MAVRDNSLCLNPAVLFVVLALSPRASVVSIGNVREYVGRFGTFVANMCECLGSLRDIWEHLECWEYLEYFEISWEYLKILKIN